MSGWSEQAQELFRSHAIDPDVAARVGVREVDGGIEYPGGRVRDLTGDGPKMKQPPGVALGPWIPDGRSVAGELVLVCEGETDALAALTALDADGAPINPVVVCLPGSSFPVDRLAAGLQAADAVYLAFDNDEAGRKATDAALQALTVPTEIVLLPEGCDLSDWIMRGGKLLEALLELDFQNQPAPDLDPEVRGDTFLFSDEDEYEVLWGEGSQILWAAGEPLLICGGDGTGKTTIAQQVALERLGVKLSGGGGVLGYPVTPTDGRVLYVAADRPKQAKRSMRRMVKDSDIPVLAERLVVLRGSHEFDIADLTSKAREYDCDTVFVDTLGAVVSGDLGSNDVGMQVYRALEAASAANIEVCLLHHDRKSEGEGGWQGIREVYGSRWITAPCGSVVMLRGKAGASDIWLRHVKQPDQAVGPAQIHHDPSNGRSYLEGRV